MTVVGAVTGEKSLMELGAVMGLVGGVGGLVAGAEGAAGATLSEGATNSALNSASDEAAAAYGGNAAVDSATQDAITGMQNGANAAPITQSGSPGIINSATQAAPIEQSAPVTSQPVQSAASQAPIAQQAASGPQADPLSVKGASAPTGAQAPVTPADYEIGGRYGPDRMDVGGGYNPGTAPDLLARGAPTNSDTFWGTFKNFAKDNQKLLAGGLQLVGGAMNGANQRDMWNQRMALEQQRVNQTSYGSQVANTTPRPGIVSGAMA